MHINKVLDWYNRAYYAAASGREQGRSGANVLRAVTSTSGHSDIYERVRTFVLRYLAGPLYWPSTWPTSVDPPTTAPLYSLVRLYRPETAVEIGTYKGNAAIAIGQALEDNNAGVLYTIDPFEQEIVHTAIRKSGLKNRIRYTIGYSYDVIPLLGLQSIDFAFIDGDHTYESVKRDFDLICSKFVTGGLLILHDVFLGEATEFDGPKKLLEEIRLSGDWDIVTFSTEAGFAQGGSPKLREDAEFVSSVGVAICKKK